MRWPLAPSVLPGESSSSWLCRCALAHGTNPIRFAGTLWPRSRTWSRDGDRLNADQHRTLASHLDSPLAVFPDDHPWVVPASVRGHARTGRTPFCPACWAEDSHPYYRLAWRYSWQVACDHHGVLLVDRCPACDGALAPHRLPVGEVTIARCDRCGADLRQAISIPAADGATAMQQRAREAYEGHGTWWGWSLSRAAWFATLRFWLVVIRVGKRVGVSPVARFAQAIAPEFRGTPPAGDFNDCSAVTRTQLLEGVASFADLDPQQALALAQTCGLRQPHVAAWARTAAPAGHWAQGLAEGATRAKRQPRRKRYGLGRPRPRSEVAAMYARLLRRAGRA